MFYRMIAFTIVLMTLPAQAAETVGGDRAFSFVALGDMPYRDGDIVKFKRLVEAVNRLKPAFTIHVGDAKSGDSTCEPQDYQTILSQLQPFEGALVYTPGDNEWTDCHRAGKQPLDRLAMVRAMLFPDPGKSLGKAPLAVESQAQAMPAHAAYVENVRFSRSDVQFMSVHVVGSNNGLRSPDADARAEVPRRDAANVAWLGDTFERAKAANAKAVVVFMQAEFDFEREGSGERMKPNSGFTKVLNALAQGARDFGKPVLVINGDKHIIELKTLKDSNGDRIPNALRLMLYGDEDVHAVRVIVDPDSPGVFGFVPLIVPENL